MAAGRAPMAGGALDLGGLDVVLNRERVLPFACAPLLSRMAAAGVDLRSGYFRASAGTFPLAIVVPMSWPSGFEFFPGPPLTRAAPRCCRPGR